MCIFRSWFWSRPMKMVGAGWRSNQRSDLFRRLTSKRLARLRLTWNKRFLHNPHPAETVLGSGSKKRISTVSFWRPWFLWYGTLMFEVWCVSIAFWQSMIYSVLFLVSLMFETHLQHPMELLKAVSTLFIWISILRLTSINFYIHSVTRRFMPCIYNYSLKSLRVFPTLGLHLYLFVYLRIFH